MNIMVNGKRQKYLPRKVRSGQFKSPSDVVNFALDQLQKDEKDLAWLKRELQKGIDEMDRGESAVWNVEETKAKLIAQLSRQRKSARRRQRPVISPK
jgi:Arc/MetJ-type ribon-helix-helix transcriptional regulator